MALKESGEMYLETIYVLKNSKGQVRSVDIAEQLDYSRASVSRGVGLLKAQGYILVDDDGHIFLTDDGTAVAEKLFDRHTILTKMLTELGVDEETAAEDACRMEHVISDRSFTAIKKHFEGTRKLIGSHTGAPDDN